MTLAEPGLRADLEDEQFVRNAESHRALVADLKAKLAAARPGVATPMVSPMLSSVHPSAIIRAAIPVTRATGTSPSHGSPKHIDR